MIYTSYFAKYRGDRGVSIARKALKGFKGERYPKLFPSSDLLYRYKNGVITKQEYREEYIKQLDKLCLKCVAEELDGKVLLCWEKDGFCHRHIVASWLNDNGYECKELVC